MHDSYMKLGRLDTKIFGTCAVVRLIKFLV